MRLFEKYRPRCLDDVVGQGPVLYLKGLAKRPFSTCLLLEGPPGCGKTSAAYAFAHELGCEDEFTDLWTVIASELSVDVARKMLSETLRFMPQSRSGFKILVIEELETLSPACQTFLKTALETRLPKSVIVIATSNDASKLTAIAVMQKFATLR